MAVFGSTLTYDCDSAVPPPPGATASCDGQTGLDDTAGDLYWRDNIANATITATQARTSATLELPPFSEITYARLYWSALKVGNQPDNNATLDWLAGPTTVITADHCHNTIPYPWATHPDWYYYQCSGDATDYVRYWGAGDFRVTDIDAIPLANTVVHVAYSAWTLVVFYENPNDQIRNLALFDGFEFVDPEHSPPSVQAQLSGFLVPQGFSARMAAFMYEGDDSVAGDHFTMNGVQVTNANNPITNFFNNSRTLLGVPYTGQDDVPAFSGVPGSMAGYDLDTVDVTALLRAGDTSATVGADSTEDKFILGGFVTSIVSKAPDFDVLKTARDVNGGAVVPNDIIEFTLEATNFGNDTAINARFIDDLEPGLEYVPGSIEIIEGGSLGPKTDQAGDDQGEYDSSQRRLTVRVGNGATAFQGGSIAPSGTVKVRFRARIVVNEGSVANSAIFKASGESGANEKTYESDSDPNDIGSQATVIEINECNTSADCAGTTPFCNPLDNSCIGCRSDADCLDPLKPACQPSGACGECSTTNTTLCTDDTPVCNTTVGECVFCLPGQNPAPACVSSPDGPVCIASDATGLDGVCGCTNDSDCGGPTSGRVCDSSQQKCIDGCRGEGGNGCPTTLVCTSPDTSIGQCIEDTGSAGSGGGGGSAGAAGAAGTGGAGGQGAEGGAGGEAGSDSGGQGGAPVVAPVVASEADNDSGCACAVASRRPASYAATALALLGSLFALRRRRSAR